MLLAVPLLLLLSAQASSSGGCSPPDCGPSSVVVRSAGLLDYRPNGPRGPLLAYRLADGRLAFRLPSGMLSADGRTFVSARTGNAATTLLRYDPRSGRRAGRSAVLGRWRLVALSANGRHLVLQRVDARTTVLRAGGRTIALTGSWRAEAISDDGQRLYLIEYLRDGYRVRLYDLALGRLQPGSLRDKTEPALMDGLGWSQLGTPDGRWLLTLFLTTGGEAAVHTLDLRTPSAVCVDLPGSDGVTVTRQYGLALAPDGRTLTAVNPALGVLVRIDVVRKAVVRRVSFAPLATGFLTTVTASADGRRIAFGARNEVWTYDARSNRVSGPVDAGRPVVALAFDAGDRHVIAVRANRTVRLLAAR